MNRQVRWAVALGVTAAALHLGSVGSVLKTGPDILCDEAGPAADLVAPLRGSGDFWPVPGLLRCTWPTAAGEVVTTTVANPGTELAALTALAGAVGLAVADGRLGRAGAARAGGGSRRPGAS